MNTLTTHSSGVSAVDRVVIAACACLSVLLCPSCSGPSHAGGGKPNLDFSHYETPLYPQIVDRIKGNVATKLGDGPNSRDRYFVVPFAYENRGNDPEFSHSFMSVIRVLPDGQSPDPRFGLKTGTFKRWNFEAYTISWIPHDFLENPHLCVFDGVGARIFPEWNKCPLSVGKNFNLEDTLKIAANAKVAVAMWGPYEITKAGFDLGIERKQLLDSGKIKYRADDRLYRDSQVACNCFHAMASLEEPYPNGGVFGTGFKMWGLNGTSQVLRLYDTRARRKGLLLDPINIEADRYGFVYSATPDARRIYNPFEKASAYHD